GGCTACIWIAVETSPARSTWYPLAPKIDFKSLWVCDSIAMTRIRSLRALAYVDMEVDPLGQRPGRRPNRTRDWPLGAVVMVFHRRSIAPARRGEAAALLFQEVLSASSAMFNCNTLTRGSPTNRSARP